MHFLVKRETLNAIKENVKIKVFHFLLKNKNKINLKSILEKQDTHSSEIVECKLLTLKDPRRKFCTVVYACHQHSQHHRNISWVQVLSSLSYMVNLKQKWFKVEKAALTDSLSLTWSCGRQSLLRKRGMSVKVRRVGRGRDNLVGDSNRDLETGYETEMKHNYSSGLCY